MRNLSHINQAFDSVMDDIVLDRAARLKADLQDFCLRMTVCLVRCTLISSTLAAFVHHNTTVFGKNKKQLD